MNSNSMKGSGQAGCIYNNLNEFKTKSGRSEVPVISNEVVNQDFFYNYSHRQTQSPSWTDPLK